MPWPGQKNPTARRRFLENCSAYGFLPDIKVEANDLLAALRLVASGLGIPFVQASLRDFLADSVIFREVPWFPSRVRVYAIWRKDDPQAACCDAPASALLILQGLDSTPSPVGDLRTCVLEPNSRIGRFAVSARRRHLG